jgi:hypothetical protein
VRLENYSRVRLLTDRYQADGVDIGAIGYIIEIYADDFYEVEFSNKDGITIAQIVVHLSEIELDDEN